MCPDVSCDPCLSGGQRIHWFQFSGSHWLFLGRRFRARRSSMMRQCLRIWPRQMQQSVRRNKSGTESMRGWVSCAFLVKTFQRERKKKGRQWPLSVSNRSVRSFLRYFCAHSSGIPQRKFCTFFLRHSKIFSADSAGCCAHLRNARLDPMIRRNPKRPWTQSHLESLRLRAV